MFKHFILNRKTIEEVIYAEGIGIHSGKKIKVRFLPADIGTGILFIHKKYGMSSPIRGRLESIVETRFAVTLGNREWQIQTVEHLMSALYILGITDIIIEVSANEFPIFDGSSAPIVKLFHEKRLYTFEDIIEPLKIINPIWMMDGDKFIIALPSDELKISYTIEFDNKILQTQYAHYSLNRDVFEREIAPARTFGFEKDVQLMKKNSFARGGSLSNALVISETAYLNEPRFSNECVRHKILDFIGDISFMGRPVLGYFIVCKSGHTFDIDFIKKLVDIYSRIDVGRGFAARRLMK